MAKKIPLVEIHCKYCGKAKKVHTWQIKQGNARFCSRQCGFDSHITKITKKCLSCGVEFKVKKNREFTAKYCSLNCYDKHSTNNPFYNKNHTFENRKLMSSIKQDIGISEWKYFTTRERARIMGTAQYRRWKETVYERDGYACVWCGATDKLNADHIKSFAFYPELRFDVDNGRTLCVPCHETTPSYLNSMGKNQYVR